MLWRAESRVKKGWENVFGELLGRWLKGAAFRTLIAMMFSFRLRLLCRDAIDQYSISSSCEAWAQARAQPELSTRA